MKLHLPVSLRKSLLSVLAVIAGVTCPTVEAGYMHEDATIATYTDFGQNRGRYVQGERVNALLTYIRETEGGIGIEYTDGTPTYYISNEQGMIDFSGVHDQGHSGLVGVNFLASVKHNGSLSGSFGEREVGSANDISYSAIDIRGSSEFRLGCEANHDYMLVRQSKIVTDATPAIVSSVDPSTLAGQHMYHAGSGYQGIYSDVTKTFTSLAWAYVYNIGDIDMITGVNTNADNNNFATHKEMGYGNGIGASLENPLPNATRPGDSGSPLYIYNKDTGRYEYIAAHQAGNSWSYGRAFGNLVWTKEAMASFNVTLDMSQTKEVHLGAVNTKVKEITDDKGNTGTVYSGKVLDASGNELATYQGVLSGVNTWSDLSGLKDTQNWYAYASDDYIAVSDADLYHTQNLVFNSGGDAATIVLDATVDLGVGYAEFNGGKYTIQSATTGDYQFNHAGYVINEGAEVHLKLTNPDTHMTEWRKTGAGDLYIDGTGDTNALLNLGGKGSTYLQQKEGYAAYNVLVNTGATVVIGDKGQIERDFTFGTGGGVLDMNGHSMDWYTSNGETPREGCFTINALTEEAMITNGSSTGVTLTYKEAGETTYLGSFSDAKAGSLVIDYQGGGTWTLNSIHTDLTHNTGSGLVVSNGTVVLSGVKTIHGTGSLSGRNQDRLVRDNDWHYADAAMNVTVKDGSTFELGSHARLDGDVTVKEGGSFVMCEGVQHAQEYIEGGAKLQDTADFSAFYGLKGNVSLEKNADMRVEFSAGTTADMSYAGDISGEGNVSVNLGNAELKLTLSGTNTFSGTKTLESGGLIGETADSLGNVTTNKWVVGKNAWLASHGFKDGVDIMSYVDTTSTGTLALSNDLTTQLNLQNHKSLYLGAEAGKTVKYGSAGTDEALEAVGGAWRLGGGGGVLEMNFLLTGDNDLLLGISEDSAGEVTLTNGKNDFTGQISFAGKGLILNAAEGALGNSTLNLGYGNALVPLAADVLKNITADSAGMLMVHQLNNAALDLSGHENLAIGTRGETTYSGDITLAEGAAYRFGTAAGGKLTVNSTLDATRDIVVDGQTFSGGTVVLNSSTMNAMSGDILVQGNADAEGLGDITLQLGRDLSTSGTVTLNKGATLQVANRTLTISNDLIGNGGKVTTNTDVGAIVFNAADKNITSSADMDMAVVRKTGANELTMTGAVDVDNLYVEAGKLNLAAATYETTVHLTNGTTLDSGKGRIDYSVNMGLNAGTATLARTGATHTEINGNFSLASGSRLNMAAGGSYKMTGTSYGGAGSTIGVDGSVLDLSSRGDISFSGTLEVKNNATINSRGGVDDMVRNFEEINIAGGQLKLWEESWNTIWNVGALSGEGELNWHSNTTHWNTSRLILSGDGGFSGTISLDRDFVRNDRTHGAFVELASDTAAKNATIKLDGAGASAVASLAVNTNNASIKGLQGNTHSYVYAGASMAEAALTGDDRPATTRQATLTTNVDAGQSFTYSGTIGNSSDTAETGLSLVKTGAGTQSFTGTTIVNNLAVQQGTLNVTAPTINGGISLSYGATLNMGDLSLNSGKTMSIAGGVSGANTAASFGGNLTLNGGTLSFDAAALTSAKQNGNAALSLGGIALGGSGATLNFTGYTSLETTTYTLASGDWSSIAGSLSASGLGFYDASFSTNDTGHLQMTLSMNSNARVWRGTESSQTWENYKYGSAGGSMSESSIAVFDGAADCKDVLVSRSSTQPAIAKIFFTGSADYTFTSTGASASYCVSAQSLTHSSSGTTTVYSGLNVRGDTVIEKGRIVLKQVNQLKGKISGEGTLVIDWGDYKLGSSGSFEDVDMYTLNIQGLDTLHIKSGYYGLTYQNQYTKAPISVKNIVMESGTEFRQYSGVNLDSNIVSKGGTISIGSAKLSGSLVQQSDTTLNAYGGNVYLNSSLQQNGYALKQTGGGTVHVGVDSAAVLENYEVQGGTLSFDTSAEYTANGTYKVYDSNGRIQVNSGTKLVLQDMVGLEAENLVINGGGLELGEGASLMGATKLTVNNAASDIALNGSNTHSGGTVINAGKLTVGSSYALGTGEVSINGGSLVVGVEARDVFTGISGLEMTDGTLDLSAISFGQDNALVLRGDYAISGGSIELGSKFNEVNTVYAIFDTKGASLNGLDWGDYLTVNGNSLSAFKDATLGVTGDGVVTLTFGSLDLMNLIIGNGETHTFTETELKEYGGTIIINEGGTLAMTDKVTADNDTSTAFNKVSGAGKVELTLAVDDNGTGYDLSTISGDVVVADGRLQVNTSKFNEASTIVLKKSSAQLIFNGTGSLQNDVVLDAATTIYVNYNNNGTAGSISGSLSGKALTKQGGGTLTLSGDSSIEWLTVSNGAVKIDGTLNLTQVKSGAVAVTGITGAGTLGLNLTGDYANTLSVASGFTGTTHLQSGKFTFNDAAFGGSLRMAGGTGIQATADTTVAGSLAMDGAAEVKVADDKTLQVNGAMGGASAYLTKNGTGTMRVSGRTELDRLDTRAGELVLAYAGEDGSKVRLLDGSMTNTVAEGTVRLAKDAKLTVTGDIWSRSVTGTILEQDASLVSEKQKVVISNKGAADASLKATSTDGTKYEINQANYELTNGHLSYTGTTDAALAHKLTNSSVENAGGGTLTVTGTGNTITGVVAGKGDVSLQNMGAAMSLNLLEIAAGKTVNAYVGENEAEKITTTTVTGSALLSGTATLNTSLTLAEGATLDMTGLDAGAVTLSGALTFGGQVTMGDKLLAMVEEMRGWQEVALFTGLTDVAGLPAALSAETNQVLAGTVFSNVDNANLFVEFRMAGDVGSLLVVHVPEPASATLGLTALMMLCARRRRKA